MRKPLEIMACKATKLAGSSWAFLLAVLIILVWLVSGPFCGFSDSWQLWVNTGTTICTFLMVFLIQRTQNKESQAIQLKLNELIAAMEGASNRLINAEDLSEKEVDKLHHKYERLANKAKGDERPRSAHTIEEEDDEEDRGYAID